MFYRAIGWAKAMKKTSISLYRQYGSGICIGALLLAFTLSTKAEQFFLADQNQRPAYGQAMARWQLKNLRTTSQGQVTYPKEGTLKRQYELQADAESTSGPTGVPAKARFRLIMDVFSPANDMGGQKKGKYYIQGRWDLLGEGDVQPSADGVLTGKIRGRLQAELAFDPTSENHDWKGIVQIPMFRVRSNDGKPGVRRMRGGGELTFTASDGGTLAFDLKLWPKF